MSRRLFALLVALALGLSARPRGLRGAPASEATRVLERADRPRAAWPEAVFRLRVTVSRPGEAGRPGLYSASVKGTDRLRIDFLDAGEEGKAFLSVGDQAFLLMPRVKEPIRVPKAHRLTGGFSSAELLRTRFADDYIAMEERTDVLDGRDCYVLRLTVRPGRHPTFAVVRLWVDRKEGLPRRASFLVPSGKTAREVAFESWREIAGRPVPGRLVIVDTLRAGTTVVEYLGAEARSLDDSLFDTSARRSLGGS